MKLLELIKQGESKVLELKEKLPSAINLAKTVVAFSNTAGGKIIIGVNDKREIVGIREDKVFELQDRIISTIYDNCYPIILPEIYTVNIEGKVVLVVEVFRGSQLPYYLKKKGRLHGTYIRVGATNRIADEKILIDLERQRLGKTFDEEENPEYDLSEIDLNPIFEEFHKIGKKVDIAKLKNLKLIKSAGHRNLPTNALLIVLGLLDNTGIKCARFKGTTMEYFIDKKEFNGDLFSVLEDTIIFLKNHLNLKAEIKGLQREEKYEIPIIALREALLNAIIHRDYTRNSDIKVAVYDDIVEIISPGGLPNGLTVDEVFNGRSELRNKVLANLFKELGYIEAWGSGINRIKKMCDEENVPFEFKETGNFVSVVFRRKIEEKDLSSIGKIREKLSVYDKKTAEKLPKKYRKTAEKVIEFLEQYGSITVKDAEKIFGVKERRAREILAKLVEEGVIEKVGKTKGTYYIKREDEGES